MKHIDLFSLCVVALLFVACGDKPNKTDNEAIKNPVGVYLDSPTDACRRQNNRC